MTMHTPRGTAPNTHAGTRMRGLAAAALAAAGLSLSACAAEDDGTRSAASAQGRQCFWAGSVNGFRDAPGDDQIYIDVGVNETYLFQTFGSCPDLDFTEALALESGPSNYVCDARDVDLIIPEPVAGPRKCPVRMIRKLEPGEPGMQ